MMSKGLTRGRVSILWSMIFLVFLLSGCGSFFEDEDKLMRERAAELEKSLMGSDGKDKPDWMKSSSDGVYKVGKPYKVNGVWYFPKEDLKYDEVGIASWYGPGFHEKTTANGELFDMDLVSCAHKTLPLPSVVRVTNLENGRTILTRVNDRGPFVNDRILDMSRKGAELLGFLPQGTAKVRVELMPEESMTVASLAQSKDHQKASGSVLSSAVASSGVVKFTNDLPEPSPVSSTTQDVTSLMETPSPLPEAPMVPAPTSVGTIYIQVGAFSSIENANRLAKDLSRVGAVPKVQPFTLNGKKLYRVRFGPFDDAANAKKIEDTIARTGHTDVKMMID